MSDRVKAPADKRFRRAQVKPTRKRASWRGRLWFVLRYGALAAAVVYGVYRGYELIDHAAALRIQHVVVKGNDRMSTAEVTAVLDGLRSQNILFANLDAERQKLLASPWIDRAVLRRVLPSTVEVVVSERHPMGIARLGSALYLVDAGGVIIDEYGPEYSHFDLPIIDGLGPAPREPGLAVDPARAEVASRLLDQVGQRKDLLNRLSQIDVGDPHDVVVIVDGDPALIHVGEERFLERLLTYLEIVPALRERVPGIDYVDMRFDERVYVRPVGGAIRLTELRPPAPVHRGPS
jgi:cell division septal protein FtsQ